MKKWTVALIVLGLVGTITSTAQTPPPTVFQPVPELPYRLQPDFFELPNGVNFGIARMQTASVRLDWQIVRPATTDLPFWCGDVTPRELRVPEGVIRRHANGVTGIATVRIVVADLAVSKTRFRALAGPEAVSVDHGIPQVSLKGTVFELIGPDNDDLRRHLAARGEGVLSLKLHGSTPRVFEPKRLHGAGLSIVA